jgi:diguanylate cyclase (GGDEF)-like protein/PAS domain S-box-containing protein
MHVMDAHSVDPELLRAVLLAGSRPGVAWGVDGEAIICNDSLAALVEVPAENLTRLNRNVIVHPDDRDEVAGQIAAQARGDRDPKILRVRLMTRTGSVVRTRSRLAPLVVGDRLVGHFLECLDVGEQLDLRDALDKQAADYRSLFEQISEAIYSLDARGNLEAANHAAERLFGRDMEELKRTPLRAIVVDDPNLRGMMEIRERFDQGERVPRRIEFRIRRPDGEIRWIAGSLLMQRDLHGAFARAFVVAHDVTEARLRELALTETAAAARQEALVDPLTGLPNRRAFDEAMIACRADCEAGAHPVLVVVDLDQLKAINDRAGHTAGDEAIRATARAISERIRGDDQAFRIGGDEFAIILQGGSPQGIEARLLREIPVEGVGTVRLSVGSAVCGTDGDDPAEVFREADRRMYAVKRERRESPDLP